MFSFKTNQRKEPLDDYIFRYEPKELDTGKQTLQDMSLIQAQYQDFLINKTGYLIALIEGSGVNLDLLNELEQEDVFDEFNAFLMSTIGEGDTGEVQQYLDMTTPVAFDDYVLYWKKRYLKVKEEQPINQAKVTLIASYVDYYQNLQLTNQMSTKKHLIVIRQKIKDKKQTSLELAAINLHEKVSQFIKILENSLENYDMEARQLSSMECRKILKHLMNFSNH